MPITFHRRVVLDENGAPLTVSRSSDPQRNIVMWLDHRAADQVCAVETKSKNHTFGCDVTSIVRCLKVAAFLDATYICV